MAARRLSQSRTCSGPSASLFVADARSNRGILLQDAFALAHVGHRLSTSTRRQIFCRSRRIFPRPMCPASWKRGTPAGYCRSPSEFALLLLETPEEARTGTVFQLEGRQGRYRNWEVSKIGDARAKAEAAWAAFDADLDQVGGKTESFPVSPVQAWWGFGQSRTTSKPSRNRLRIVSFCSLRG